MFILCWQMPLPGWCPLVVSKPRQPVTQCPPSSLASKQHLVLLLHLLHSGQLQGAPRQHWIVTRRLWLWHQLQVNQARCTGGVRYLEKAVFNLDYGQL